MNTDLSRLNTDNFQIRVCADKPGELNSTVVKKYVLADYHFKIPFVHLQFLHEVFSQMEKLLKKHTSHSDEDVHWQTYWLSQVFAIRVMQYHEIHRKQGKYTLNNTYRLYLNRLFINTVCWYLEKYSLLPVTLPGKPKDFFAFVYSEASMLLDSHFSYTYLLDGKERINNLFSSIGGTSRQIQEWNLFESLRVEFSSICIETIIAAEKTGKLPKMDPDTMEKRYISEKRYQYSELSMSVQTELQAEPEAVVNGN